MKLEGFDRPQSTKWNISGIWARSLFTHPSC